MFDIKKWIEKNKWTHVGGGTVVVGISPNMIESLFKGKVLVDLDELKKFYDIADNYFVSFGNMSNKEYEFIDSFIEKYNLEDQLK